MKIRVDHKANYRAMFFNGKTVRTRIDRFKPITTPTNPEIEDVAINSKCLAACFIAGTKINTSSGYKDIEDININDTVISFDTKKLVFEEQYVYHLFKNYYNGKLIKIELENNKIIYCTPNHKFFTNIGWVEAGCLTLEHELTDINNQ